VIQREREEDAKRVKGRELFLRLMSKLWVGVGSYHVVYKFKFGRYLFNRLVFVFLFFFSLPCSNKMFFPGLGLSCLSLRHISVLLLASLA